MAEGPFTIDAYSVSFAGVPHYFHGQSAESGDNVYKNIIFVIISAMIFVTVISLFEVFRVHYIYVTTRDSLYSSAVSRRKREELLAVDRGVLRGTLIFAFFVLATSLFFIPVLIYYYNK